MCTWCYACTWGVITLLQQSGVSSCSTGTVGIFTRGVLHSAAAVTLVPLLPYTIRTPTWQTSTCSQLVISTCSRAHCIVSAIYSFDRWLLADYQEAHGSGHNCSQVIQGRAWRLQRPQRLCERRNVGVRQRHDLQRSCELRESRLCGCQTARRGNERDLRMIDVYDRRVFAATRLYSPSTPWPLPQFFHPRLEFRCDSSGGGGSLRFG